MSKERFGIECIKDGGDFPILHSDRFRVCLCDCGNTIKVNGKSLRDKHTKSCECLRQ